jgi:hypothetical protein
MDPKGMLGVLLHMVETQQKAIDGLIGDLKGEVAALKTAAGAVQNGATKVKTSAQAVDDAVGRVLPAVQIAAAEGAKTGVAESMKGAAETAVTALDKASQPMLEQLTGVVQAASAVEGKLRKTASWFPWQLMVMAAGTTGAAMLVLWTLASVYVWWQRSDIEALAAQRRELREEVIQLQNNAEEWARKGGRAKLERCGEQERLCVRVDTKQVYGEKGDTRYVLHGY